MVTTIAALDPNKTWYVSLAAFAIVMAIGAVWARSVWEDLKGETEDLSHDPRQVLDPLTNAFTAGQMTPEEYARVRESVEREDQDAVSPHDSAPPPGGPQEAAARQEMERESGRTA